MSRLCVRMLGPFRAAIDGDRVTGFRSDKTRALLAYLSVESDIPHRRERLAGLLWPEFPEQAARGHLRVALANLRRVISDHAASPPHLLISRQTIQLNADSDIWIDTRSFLSLIRSRRPTVQDLEEAAKLYKGEFMTGFTLADSLPFEEWALLTRERLHRLFVEALYRLTRLLEEQGDVERGLEYARRQLELDPWREAAHRQVMRLLALNGQRSAALAQFESCSSVLREELGVGVSAQTWELYERLEQGAGPEGARASVPTHNLPVQVTSFEGREEELSQIDQLLSDPDCRLLTLLGPGGIGKTRLALEAAARELRAFVDGVFFVPLAHVSSPEFVLAEVADALRFNPDTTGSNLDLKTQLIGYLRERSALLLMDSFEQLVWSSGLLDDILRHAPNIKLLVTSRERLHLSAEWVLYVRGMRYPENGDGSGVKEYGARKLFLARARQADAGFALSAQERPYVDAICRHLDGMPLGIEIAAAWVPVLSCREIASEIEMDTGILASPEGDGLGAHHSLRATFDRSWKLLRPEAQAGFRKLAVFRGGFRREASAAVVDVDLARLSELVNKSLLRRNSDGRFDFHELLRQYARGRLDARPEEKRIVQERHSRYYVGFLSERERDLFGERLPEIKQEIRAELENLRLAILWAVTHWSEAEALDALACLEAFCTVDGWYAGIETFAKIGRALEELHRPLSRTESSANPALPVARVYEALYCSLLGECERAEKTLEDCLPRLRGERERAVGLFGLGASALYRGDLGPSRGFFEESVALAQSCQNARWVANGLMWLGWVVAEQGDLDGAMAVYRESYSLYRELGSLWGMAFVLSKQGLVADGQREYRQAERYHKEALETMTAFGDREGEAYVTSRLSATAYCSGRYAEARRLGRHGYELFEEIGHRWGVGASLCRIGFAALGLERRHEAKSCFHQALELAADMNHIPLVLYSLVGMACLLAEEGEEAQAVELLSLVESHPQRPLTYLDYAERWFSGIEERLPGEVLMAARERGGGSELHATVEAVLRGQLQDGCPRRAITWRPRP